MDRLPCPWLLVRFGQWETLARDWREEEIKVTMFIPPARPCGLHPWKKVPVPAGCLLPSVVSLGPGDHSLYSFKSKARNCQDLDWYR